MPPKKAEKVPRRARARARDRSPHGAAGFKIVGVGLVLVGLTAGWLNALGKDEADNVAVPYTAGGVTAITGGGRDAALPSSRAAVPVPFGPSTLVTVDEGLVTTTTTPDGTVTTTSIATVAAQAPRLYSIAWWSEVERSRPAPPGRREPGTSSTTGPPHPTHPSTTTTRPTTTTTTRPSTTTTEPTTTTTEGSTTTTESTTTTTEATTSTTEGSTTTSP